MTRVDAAVDDGGKQKPAALLEPLEAVEPKRIVGREASAGDGDEASALGQPRQGRREMAESRIADAAFDMSGGGERRVHEDDGRVDGDVEMIVDVCCVVRCYRDVREQQLEQGSARVGDLVKDEPSACEFGEDREQASPGGRLEDEVGARDRGGCRGNEAEGHRRRELLAVPATFPSAASARAGMWRAS